MDANTIKRVFAPAQHIDHVVTPCENPDCDHTVEVELWGDQEMCCPEFREQIDLWMKTQREVFEQHCAPVGRNKEWSVDWDFGFHMSGGYLTVPYVEFSKNRRSVFSNGCEYTASDLTQRVHMTGFRAVFTDDPMSLDELKASLDALLKGLHAIYRDQYDGRDLPVKRDFWNLDRARAIHAHRDELGEVLDEKGDPWVFDTAFPHGDHVTMKRPLPEWMNSRDEETA